MQIVPLLMPLLQQQARQGRVIQCAAMLLLESYFAHGGNWPKMERELAGATPPNPAHEKFVALVADSLMKGAATSAVAS